MYRSYVQDDYLKPLGLNDDVIPETTKPDARNARPHNYDKDNKPVPIDLEEADLGLAAGGFIASAQDLARLMAHLEARYSSSELDDMGWGKTSKGKLEHSGGRDGGVAHVTMFPQSYKSNDNVYLSRVHVAMATNI